jgi:tRNA pseudouridine13 synthase
VTLPELKPPAPDAAFGLGFYGSRSPGADGRAKATADAFVVTEISDYPLPDPEGPFTVVRVRSRDWEQHELAAAIARRWGLPPHALRWAGTKDRRAVAERLFSFRGVGPERPLDLPRVELLEAYRARTPLVLGHHFGNAFAIRIDALAVDPATSVDRYRAIEAELRARHGLPNFFGPQRFGEVRPVTAAVGRALVRGDVAGAVETYLTEVPALAAPGPGDVARRAYAEHHDPARALREFPSEYRFERTLLDHLARGRPPERAFHALARELRLLFVHAYQSLLFNRWVTARWAAGLPLDRPVAGDRILRYERDGTVRGDHPVPVDDGNLPECTALVERDRAVVAGPLVGYATPSGPDRPSALLEQLLAEEGIDRGAFSVPRTPDVASRGAYRPLLLPLPPIGLAPEPEAVTFRFALPRGAYATVLLREFLKSGAST